MSKKTTPPPPTTTTIARQANLKNTPAIAGVRGDAVLSKTVYMYTVQMPSYDIICEEKTKKAVTLVPDSEGRLLPFHLIDWEWALCKNTNNTVIANQKREGDNESSSRFHAHTLQVCHTTAIDDVDGFLLREFEQISDAEELALEPTQKTGNKQKETIKMCAYCSNPKDICDWVLLKDDLTSHLVEGTLFRFWEGPLPFGTPSQKYYRWAGFEYYMKKRCGPRNYRWMARETKPTIPMCVRIGVEVEWYPEHWNRATAAAAAAVVTPVKSDPPVDDGNNKGNKKRKAE
jgi:hypothetical protein